tara:strand:+ start:518 stop:667 length:150 start_codon:yes stop_codon:yes gene_type:complete
MNPPTPKEIYTNHIKSTVKINTNPDDMYKNHIKDTVQKTEKNSLDGKNI